MRGKLPQRPIAEYIAQVYVYMVIHDEVPKYTPTRGDHLPSVLCKHHLRKLFQRRGLLMRDIDRGISTTYRV
jgi:hypothetical protein